MGKAAVKASLMLIAWLAAAATGVVFALHDATSILGLLLLFGTAFGWFMWGFVLITIFDVDGRGRTEVIGLIVTGVLVAALFGLGSMLHTLGPAYHTRYGEHAEVLITQLTQDTQGVHCRISLSATEQDLGWLDGQSRTSDGCAGRVTGDRIEVSVDPRGWVTPVSVNRLGSELPLLIALGIFVTVVVVFVIAFITAAAITRWLGSHPQT